ncbi:DnaB-like helicase C-terminal domain-containing protein [Pseudodesulfovibrio cashew]|nr:DnaB-like helicase C-terminal domain-containing protein [Pseudodesulfovibrio cashew]
MRRKAPTHINSIVPGLVNEFPNHEPETAAACVIGNLHGGQLITVASRPSVGKTNLAAHVVARVSALTPTPVSSAVFSLEGAADMFAMRILSAVFCGNLHQAATLLSHAPIVIDDTPGISELKLTDRCRDLAPLGLVVIDYLQLLRSGLEHGSPEDEINRVVPGLKKLAEDLDAPVIILFQLPRHVDKRPDRRPELSDLNQALADASDMVILLTPGHDHHSNHIIAKS